MVKSLALSSIASNADENVGINSPVLVLSPTVRVSLSSLAAIETEELWCLLLFVLVLVLPVLVGMFTLKCAPFIARYILFNLPSDACDSRPISTSNSSSGPCVCCGVTILPIPNVLLPNVGVVIVFALTLGEVNVLFAIVSSPPPPFRDCDCDCDFFLDTNETNFLNFLGLFGLLNACFLFVFSFSSFSFSFRASFTDADCSLVSPCCCCGCC